MIEREGEAIPATLVLPREGRGPFPPWIAIGGVSRMGRRHPQLVRFAEALAHSGSAVLVPEIPEWQALEVTPRVIGPTIEGGLEWLSTCEDARPGKVGVIGFSFGAPGVAMAASQDDLSERVAGIVLFGGYCCLDRTMRCLLTGRHEWEGTDYQLNPDPYGRYVVASNHLTDVPGREDAGEVAEALHHLACAASELRISAWDPRHNDLIRELRTALPQRHHDLFDCLARPTDGPPADVDRCLALAEELTEACRRVEPWLDPGVRVQSIGVPTQLLHGRGDRLVPFTEGLRLMDAMPEEVRRGITVTRLFNHSADHELEGFTDQVVEKAALFRALQGLINTV